MADIETKVPAPSQETAAERTSAPEAWRPLDSLRREVDRMFDAFDRGFWRFPSRGLLGAEPFWGRAAAPAVDIVEHDEDYQVTAELPGMSEQDIELKIANNMLTIKGEKKEAKEEKQRGCYLSERHYGAFERSFWLPEGVDSDKIEAGFSKGILTITLPKKPEAIKAERKIAVKPS